MKTVTGFEQEFRIDMSDPAGTGQTFTSTTIDSLRKKAIRHLYKIGLGLEDSNFAGTYTTMPLADTTTVDFALPTGWQRVTTIEYWENTTNTRQLGVSGMWDDRARSGYVRIFDAPDYAGYRIHLMGLKTYSDVDDTSMPDEVYDVCLYAAELFAAKILGNRRAKNRKTTSAQDVSLGAEVMWVRQLKQDYRDAVRDAKKAMRFQR